MRADRLRRFIVEYNQRTGATILLTSHYLADVEACCSRILLFRGGRIAFDRPIRQLIAATDVPYKVVVRREATPPDPERFGALIGRREGEIALAVRRAAVKQTLARLIAEPAAVDFTVEDASLEEALVEKMA